MPTKLDAKAAAAAVQEKQQLEVMLAWELLEVFNDDKSDLRAPLRDAADMALQEMIIIRDAFPGPGVAVLQAAIKAELDVISILKNHRAKSKIKDDLKFEGGQIDAPAKLNVLLKEVQKMDAQEISEVIRFYGTFVEKAAENKDLEGVYKQLNEKKSGFRKGTEKFDANAVWNTGKKGETAGRHREMVLSDGWKELVAGLQKAKAPPNQVLELTVKFLAETSAVWEKSSRGAVQNFLVSMEGGQRLFALKDTSTIGKIDHLFGLVPASDISGTTTDTLFFLNRYKQIDPIFQTLPLATIVAGAHHSIIEVALPLTMNKFVDYHIGFYTTLLPAKSKHTATAAIKKALEKAEKEPYNHFLLVWYTDDGKAIAGAYEFKPSEKKQFEAFKAFAKAEEVQATLSKVKAITSAVVEEIMTKNGLK